MKTELTKFNLNAILCALVFLFIGVGIVHYDTYYYLKETAYAALVQREAFSEITQRIETISNEQQRYHQDLINLYTIFQRETGSAIIEKDDGTVVVRMKNGQLNTQIKKIPPKEIENCVNEVKKLAETAENNNAGFLYVMAPAKGDYGIFPIGVDNYAPENYTYTLEKLEEANVPVLNLKEKMMEDGIFNGGAFFDTDHHWKPLTGFWAFGEICEELNRRYGFEYDMEYTDITNYSVETIPESFLGSTGKKVGQYFSRLGLDDFDVISPQFNTSLIENRPFAEESREGKFDNTVCFSDRLDGAIENKNSYSYYSGGDYRLQKFTNIQKPDGKTILMVRDSFACTVAPFLALETKEIILTDTRNYEYYVGPKQNVHEMIHSIKPDYVLVLYSGGAGNASGRFDFN